MNSSVLQQNYPKLYQKLFSQCSLVLSAPLGFYWTESTAYHYNGLMVRQKLPMKVYLGVEFNQGNSVELGTLTYFSSHDDKFVSYPFDQYWPNREDFLAYLNSQDSNLLKKRGIRFHAIVENVLFSYPNTSRAAITALIATALRILSGQLESKQIAFWKDFSPKILLAQKDLEFVETFNLARTINCIVKRAYTWNTACFSVMVPTSYPIISFPAKNVSDFDYEYHRKTNFTHVADVPFWGYDLRDLYPDLPKEAPIFPLDIASIFSGKRVMELHNNLKGIKTNYGIDDIQEFIATKFSSDLIGAQILPDFYENFGPEGRKKEYNSTDSLSIISIRLIKQLYQLFSRGYDENVVNEFINFIYARQCAVAGIDYISEHMRKVFHQLNADLFHSNSSGNFSLFAMYDVTLGGNIGFVSAAASHRESLENSIKSLQKDYSDLSIEYLSWRDGYCSDGVIVEQFLDEGMVSKHLDKNALRRMTYRFDQHQEAILPDDHKDEGGAPADMTLDLIENTISIDDQPISSKELHSQTATINLLKALLLDPGRQIMSTDLPRSAYSISKNEMRGKITGPLMYLVEKRTGKKFEIVLKGTNEEFSILLKMPYDFTITTVQKLF